MPCQVKSASSGSRTWKLNEIVPTSAIITSGISSSGVRAHVAQRGRDLAAPARRPASASAARAGPSSAARRTSPGTRARSRRKHGAMPNSAIDDARRGGAEDARGSGRRREFSATALTTRSGPDDLDHERLPRRVVQRQHRAAHQHQRQAPSTARRSPLSDSPNSVSAGTAIDSCVIVSSVPLRHPVGEQAAPGAEQQDREELQAGGEPDRDAGAGQLHHQPHLADDLHPVAGDRDHLAGEVPAVVRERCSEENVRATRSLAVLLEHRARGFRRRGRARRGPRGSGGPAAGPGKRPCDRARRRAARARPASSTTRLERRSAGSARARDEPGLLQPREHPRGRRALDLLARGELGRRQRPVAVDRRQRGALGRAQVSAPACWRMRRASRVITGRRRWARSVVEMVRIG